MHVCMQALLLLLVCILAWPTKHARGRQQRRWLVVAFGVAASQQLKLDLSGCFQHTVLPVVDQLQLVHATSTRYIAHNHAHNHQTVR
jgi:hypothetical protein